MVHKIVVIAVCRIMAEARHLWTLRLMSKVSLVTTHHSSAQLTKAYHLAPYLANCCCVPSLSGDAAALQCPALLQSPSSIMQMHTAGTLQNIAQYAFLFTCLGGLTRIYHAWESFMNLLAYNCRIYPSFFRDTFMHLLLRQCCSL